MRVMNPVGATKSLIIETRRAARAKADCSGNGISINCLGTDLDAGGRDQHGAQNANRPRSLYRAGAERDVPFRYSTNLPRLNAAFAAQLLGQAMPDRASRASGALAAYEPSRVTALICDRRL